MSNAALLSQIQQGKRLKKVEVNDRSAPIIDSKAKNGPRSGGGGGGVAVGSGGASAGPSIGGGAPQLGGLFAGGIPKLKPAGTNSASKNLTLGKAPSIPRRNVDTQSSTANSSAASTPSRPSPRLPPARAVPAPTASAPKPPSAPPVPRRPPAVPARPASPPRTVSPPPRPAPQPPARAAPPPTGRPAPSFPPRKPPPPPTSSGRPAPPPPPPRPSSVLRPSASPAESPVRATPPPPPTRRPQPEPTIQPAQPPPPPGRPAQPPRVRALSAAPAPAPPPAPPAPPAPRPPAAASASVRPSLEANLSPIPPRASAPFRRAISVSGPGSSPLLNGSRSTSRIPSPPPSSGPHTFLTSADLPPPRTFTTTSKHYASATKLYKLSAKALSVHIFYFSLMRLSTALASLLAWTAAVQASDVLDLDAYNFESVVNPEALILVEFFAPWCGHCKALAPHYETAATALKEKNISLAKVNCVDQADLCQQHGVQGYPTLKVFRSGAPTDYTGPRQSDGIVNYMLKQSLPAVSSVTTANFEEFKTADKIVAIAFVADSTEPPSAFATAAEKHRDDYLFGYSTDSELFAQAEVTPPAIVLYRKFDEPKIVYPGDAASATAEDIEAFIKRHIIPYVAEVGPENYQAYVSSGLPLAYLFVDVNNEELVGQHSDYLTKLAKEFKGKINFVTIDSTRFADHAKQLNLKEATWPAFVIQELGKQLKYPLDQALEVNDETVSDHVRKYISGEVKPALKSQPVPEQNETVYTVVSSQFEDIAADVRKDVFIEFYAPWCGHCKRLKPTWDSLGDRYHDIQDRLLIAKMDATENDIPPSAGFHVSGFPSIKFKQAGSTEFVDYNGDRSLDSFIEFIEANAKNSLEKPSATPTPEEAIPEPTSEAVETPTHDHDEL